MNAFGGLDRDKARTPQPKRKREDSVDIPRPFLRGGGGAATGANAIGVKMMKIE